MNQETYTKAFEIMQDIKQTTRHIQFMGVDPISDKRYQIELAGPPISISLITLNNVRSIIKKDLELELSLLQKQFDEL